MGIIFSCRPCGHRSGHTFSRVAYEEGIVIVRCTNQECGKLHLVADNGGRLGFDANVEDLLKQQGKEATWVTDQNLDTIELTPDMLQFANKKGDGEE